MPLQERWASLVKIARARGDGIFRVATIGEFAGVLKNLLAGMDLFHGLQQQIDDLGVKVAADQHFGVGADQLNVVGRDRRFDTDRALWQLEPGDIRKRARKRIRQRKVHQTDLWILQQFMNRGRARAAVVPDDVDTSLFQGIYRGRPAKRQECRGVRIDAGPAEDSLGCEARAAALRSDRNALAFQLAQVLQRLLRHVKNPEWIVVDEPQ